MTTVLVLLFIGFGLVVAEVFFPSLGVLAILAGIFLIGAVITGFDHSSAMGWVASGTTLGGLPMVVWLAFRVFPKTPMGKKMIVSGTSWKEDERAAIDHEVAQHVGQNGVAVTALRPAGIAAFDDHRVDVLTRGELIEPGQAIRALEFESNRLIVQAIAAESPNS